MMVSTKNVSIRGVSSALPNNEIDLGSTDSPYFSAKEIKKTLNMIGTKKVRRALDHQTTSDLCFAAAEKLLSDLQWDSESIDALIFLSQTPDYILPATSCVLQGRLELSSKCITFDIAMGCSGYTYGLYIVSQLIQSGSIKRGLLLVGDTISKIVSPHDRSVSLLFGDAGTATALEYCKEADNISFSLGTDGKGAPHLMVSAGGYRQPSDNSTQQRILQQDGHIRSLEDLFMNGAEVFNFTAEVVPQLLKQIVNFHKWQEDEINYYLMHQANMFMLDFLRKKSDIDSDKMLINIGKFGNTSSASIPLLLCDYGNIFNNEEKKNVIMCGFGVGLSWGAAAVTVHNLTTSIIYV